VDLGLSSAGRADLAGIEGHEYASELRIYHEVELWGFEPQTSCMPSAGNPSTGVHHRRSPSRSMHSSPPKSGQVAVLPCCTPPPVRSSPRTLRYSPAVCFPDRRFHSTNDMRADAGRGSCARHRAGRETCSLRSLPHAHYWEFEFWIERDLVWTVQTRLRKLISDRGLPWTVFNDYPLLPGTWRARSADVVIRDMGKEVLVAAELKYEPSHHRAEFRALPGKLPVVFWGMDGVAKDVARVREFVDAGSARTAFAVFIDEGRHFRQRPAHPDAEWRDWDAAQPGSPSPSILWAQWPVSLTQGDLEAASAHGT